jgi:D-methionine transport system substrate-binding protein
MNMKKSRLTICIMLAMTVFCLAMSVGQNQAQAREGKKLKLGCLAYSEPMVQWIKEGLEPFGYSVEIIMFDANQLPATALKDGSIDGIIANHRPWILTFNREKNCNLEMVKPYYFYSFFAVYSVKHKNLEDLPQNSKIAVPGDPSNMSRSLIVLEKAGLITLNEKSDIFYTVLDIKDNPKQITLLETEITQTARSIQDVDAIITSAYFVSEAAHLDPKDYLFVDPQNEEYALGLIVRSEDLDAEWAKMAMQSLRSEEYRKKFKDHYQGKYILYQ